MLCPPLQRPGNTFGDTLFKRGGRVVTKQSARLADVGNIAGDFALARRFEDDFGRDAEAVTNSTG